MFEQSKFVCGCLKRLEYDIPFIASLLSLTPFKGEVGAANYFGKESQTNGKRFRRAEINIKNPDNCRGF
ncbi:hypothetical protein [Capnocytophaga sp.]|uniref:hypothetical protein n=1 Tax=Capnocytophaga sp. TaxID=44737 RepID=UPI0026DD82A6|nr:hypothetical protein [Capnocytophaga sp.]MDO5104296.1 hypothetical protein [Capnocytophaga sp.]